MAKSPRNAAAPGAGIAKLKSAYDAVVKGGHVIDPANNLDGVFDIGIKKGRIAAVAPTLEHGAATRVIDARGLIVTPGLIDTHAHVYEHVSGDFGLNPDLVGIRSGVTTVVDQGGPSALTFDGFRKFIVEPARTRVLAFISAYLAGGLLGHRYVDLYGPTGINVKAIVKAARDNADLARGIKAHAEPGGYSRWGMAALKLAKEASREVQLPVYIHLGTLWPELQGAKVDAAKIIDEVVPLLDPGDILAHPFTRFPSGFVAPDSAIHPLMCEALAKGVRIADGGRAYRGMFTGEGVDSIVADERASPFVRPYSLHHAMSELLALGVPLAETIRMATQNAAIMLGLGAEMGALSIGMPADLSVMRLIEGEWTLIDSERVTHKARQLLHPEFAVRGGKVHRADSPLLPAFAALAA